MSDLDLEREVREALRRHEADVRDLAAAPVAPDVVHRTRRRQIVTALATVGVVVALVAASAVGIAALMRSAERRVPAQPPDTFSAGPLEAVPTDSHDFSSLTVATDGALWWTGPGLSRFDPDSGAIRTFTLADDPAFELVSSIEPAREGGVWILTDASEIRRFDGEAFHENLGPGPVCNLAEAPDGTLWGSGCEEGVFRWDGASWVRMPPPGDQWLGGGDIAVAANGQVWVTNLEHRPDAPDIGHGASRFDETGWTTWTKSDGLPSDRVETVAIGPRGEVWVGTDDGVAARWDAYGRFPDGPWGAYPGSETGIPDVWSVVVTDGQVLISGYVDNQSRFALFDGNAWTPVTAEGGLGTTSSHPSIAVDDRGVLWAATSDAGLYRSDGSRWERVVASMPRDFGRIAAAGPNELWATDAAPFGGDDSYAGFPPGVWRFREGTGTRFAEGDGLPGGRVAQIAVAPDGVPWVAAERGLARFDGSAWHQVAPGPHYVIAFAPDGTPWTATRSTATVDGVRRTGIGIHPVGGAVVGGPAPLDFYPRFLTVGPGDEAWASCWAAWGGESCNLARFDGAAWESVELPTTAGVIAALRDIEATSESDLWISAAVQAGKDRWASVVFRYRGGVWTELVETDAGARLDTPYDPSAEWSSGKLESTPDGHLLLLARDGLFIFRDGVWSRVATGRFSDLSVAPDGTVWLVGDGRFRLRVRS